MTSVHQHSQPRPPRPRPCPVEGLRRALVAYRAEIVDADAESPAWRRGAREAALDRARACGLSSADARAIVAAAALAS